MLNYKTKKRVLATSGSIQFDVPVYGLLYKVEVDGVEINTAVVAGVSGDYKVKIPVSSLAVVDHISGVVAFKFWQPTLTKGSKVAVPGKKVVGATEGITVDCPKEWTVQAKLTGTGTLACVLDIEVSNNGVDWIKAGTITLSDTSATDGFANDATWKYVRGNVKSISGTNAAVSMTFAA